jgi:predicted membrane protein
MKNQLTIAGGVLTIISVFLPFTTLFGRSISFMDIPNGDAPIWLVCGVVIAVVGLTNKKMLSILSFVLGLSIAGMALYYRNKLSIIAGYGLWIMLLGGILSVVGSVKRLRED